MQDIIIDEIFSDRISLDERLTSLRLAFDFEIFLPKGFLDKEEIKGDVLDLGCGKGAVGVLLKEKCSNIKRIVGVDPVLKQGEDSGLSRYSEVRVVDAFSEVRRIAREGEKYDFVVGVGLPGGVVDEFLNGGIDWSKIVRAGGSVLFLLDHPLRDLGVKSALKAGFSVRSGDYPVNSCILFWQNKAGVEEKT